MNSNGTTFKGPWWVTVIERTGSLGIVVIMLVGGFLIMKDYTNDMRKTWEDIHKMMVVESKLEAGYRATTSEFMNGMNRSAESNSQFLHSLSDTMGNRLDAMEKRIHLLERRTSPTPTPLPKEEEP